MNERIAGGTKRFALQLFELVFDIVAAEIPPDEKRETDEQHQHQQRPGLASTARFLFVILVDIGVDFDDSAALLAFFILIYLHRVAAVGRGFNRWPRTRIGFEVRLRPHRTRCFGFPSRTGAESEASAEQVSDIGTEFHIARELVVFGVQVKFEYGQFVCHTARFAGRRLIRLGLTTSTVRIVHERRAATAHVNGNQRAFLDTLLETPSPSGFETRGQRVWTDYVAEFADDVRTDDYGNAVAVHEGATDAPTVALTGHADEIGFVVRDIDGNGFVRLGAIGGADKTVSRGQHVTIHTDDGPVSGVIGQTAIHLRDDHETDDIADQHVDIGAADEDGARELVDIGDPLTISTTVQELDGTRLAARGMDNRIGTWAAAEGLRRASEADADATICAVSTVQEEVGFQGARMVGFDLAPDAAVVVDVTHATDDPATPQNRSNNTELGDGPVIARGGANHPVLVEATRGAADTAEIPIQLQATGSRTGTDADAIFTQRGGIPSLNLGLPNRYMHTPVEVIDTTDLDALAALLGRFAERVAVDESFAVEV
jgi:putative aminopeptidase FrvX